MAKEDASGPTIGREAVVAALVAAATRLFAERGPDGVALRAVAAEAGVNYGLIHHYVGTRDDLLRLVLHAVSAQNAQEFAGADADGIVERLIRTQPSEFTATLTWALLQGHDPHTLVGRSPGLRALVDRLDRHDAEELVAAIVSMALGWQIYGPYIRAGLGRGDNDAEAFTRALRALARQLVSAPSVDAPDAGDEQV